MDYIELSDNLNEQLSKARGERDIAIKHMVDLEYQVCRLREELQKNEASLSEIFSRTYGPFKQKIGQWLQAEHDGRLVVLPCKVVCGTTIWWADSNFHANPIKCEVSSFGIYTGPDGGLQVWMNCYVFGPTPMSISFRMSSIGKTVFLTREEAEAALKGGDG